MVEEGQQRSEANGSTVLEDQHLQVPFPVLHGECVEHVGRGEGSVIALTSYRLHIKLQDNVISVPLKLIESVVCRDLTQLHLTCKDCKIIRCHFLSPEQCQDWLRRITAVMRPPARLEELFAFTFLSCSTSVSDEERELHDGICRAGGHQWRFKSEMERMSFDTHSAWRISNINSNYRLCASYPKQIVVPAAITDQELENIAAFRSGKRIPSVVYRHQSSGAVIGRCGQPEVSWWGWRNADDERMIQVIAKACATDPHMNGSCVQHHVNGTISDSDTHVANGNMATELSATSPQKLLIMDARSYAAAVANRAKGGGCECPEYYPNCEVMFMGMANIHSIRKSFQCLRTLCAQDPDPVNWLSAVEGTKWLQHLSLLLKASLLVVNAVDRDHRPVLVHCSDGWDRTPQIVALSKLLLDPFYRTIEGFQVLVEMEWLDYGHKFADRCGHGENEDPNERCPVFLQWLDCVHQLQRQFPCSFQFNEAFLVKLVQHTYSCLFGTFLCNSVKEREERCVQKKTCSVWTLLRPTNPAFHNILYSPRSEANLMLWSAIYLPNSAPSTPSDESCVPYFAPLATPASRLPKTRSYNDLPASCESLTSAIPNRRSSDPNLTEKWQDHTLTREITMTTKPDMTSTQTSESSADDSLNNSMTALDYRLNWTVCEINDSNSEMLNCDLRGNMGISVENGVTDSQIKNILQEAKEEDNRKLDLLINTPSCDIPDDSAVNVMIGATHSDASETNSEDRVCGASEELEDQAVEIAIDKSLTPNVCSPSSHSALYTNGNSESEMDGLHLDNEMPCANVSTHDPLQSSSKSSMENHTPYTHPPSHTSSEPPKSPKTLNGIRSPPQCPVHPLSPPSSNQDSPLSYHGSCAETSAAGDGFLLTSHNHSAGVLVHGPAVAQQLTPLDHQDKDGLSFHSDAVQVRLRQMEAGHQLQVEMLKKQVQELWSRLHVNGKLTSLPDGENNVDSGCLSRCSTELLSQSNWEQIKQQDTEVTHWYSDHPASRCYGCERTFWLATRKHHCSGREPVEEAWNCGNVFCASCCEKVTVPSQQLREPNHMCQACYGHLRPSGVPPALPPADLELEKPITASSN
ncbi:myotubularin-related protein 3-like isoform X3 [Myxocyprinus asiaticus]|uniref:myotubularin-related protein 3-like isoform X3 n=1 Tax=Myxocyprinus asiaticus TaxID=70543 RepID=UPI0022224C37|nr:myotubularin-related protein 3-like isoform X3 [Myxocyprinus asiaticus]